MGSVLMTNEQRKKFLDLSCQLSPENLYCDGEISKAEANRKYARLMKEWRTLEREVGRSVDEWEVWTLTPQ
jgi:hypothetical protein